MQPEQTSHDLLVSEDFYIRADTGKRLLNYVIDLVLFYLIFFAAGILLAILSPSAIDNLTDDSAAFSLIDRLFTLILYGLYMSVVEAVFKGKSMGKLITGTRAVNFDGSRISAGKAFERGFSRAVPFCAFSAFGNPCNPWQDRWTNTMVIDEKKSNIQY